MDRMDEGATYTWTTTFKRLQEAEFHNIKDLQ